MLDSCTDTDSAENAPQAAVESAAAGNVPAEARPTAEKPVESETAPANTDGGDADVLSAELMLLLALGGQPSPEGKEEKTAVDMIPGGTVVSESKADSDGPQPAGDASQATDADTAPLVPAPVVLAVAAPIPGPAEGAAPPASGPGSVEVASTATIDVSSQTGIDAKVENASRSAEAIEATISAQADKNKTSQAEKPTSAAAEQTLKTPAAFRSAASTKELSSGEAPKADTTEQGPPALPKDTAAAPKTPHGDIETPEPKPNTAAPQASPDAGTNAAPPPAPLQANTGSHQLAQPASIQSGPATAHVPISGLAVEIAAHAQAGKNRFEIRLDPPELGRIDVRLDVGSDGQVTSHLRVERAETLDLLRRDAPTLERALQQAGLKTSDSGLQFSLHNQSFSWHQQDRDMPDMARIVVPDETLPPVDTQRQYGRLAGLGSGVDIRV